MTDQERIAELQAINDSMAAELRDQSLIHAQMCDVVSVAMSMRARTLQARAACIGTDDDIRKTIIELYLMDMTSLSEQLLPKRREAK